MVAIVVKMVEAKVRVEGRACSITVFAVPSAAGGADIVTRWATYGSSLPTKPVVKCEQVRPEQQSRHCSSESRVESTGPAVRTGLATEVTTARNGIGGNSIGGKNRGIR
jgi:hypothetical protein